MSMAPQELWIQVDDRDPARLEADPHTLFDVLKGLLMRGRTVRTRTKDDEQPDGWTGWLPVISHPDGSLRRQH